MSLFSGDEKSFLSKSTLSLVEKSMNIVNLRPVTIKNHSYPPDFCRKSSDLGSRLLHIAAISLNKATKCSSSCLLLVQLFNFKLDYLF